MSLNLALIQFNPSKSKKDNVCKACTYISEAASMGADIVLLQELFNTGYFPKRPISKENFYLAEPVPGPTIDRVCEEAQNHGIYVIAPIYEEDMTGVYYNTAVFIGPKGEIIGKYRKNHLPENLDADEKFYFTPGNLGFPVFMTHKVKVGIVICADRHYPETFRILGLRGAELVLVPSAIGVASMKDYWKIELCGAAIANMYYVAGVNYVGGVFWGMSLVVDPTGVIISQAGNEDDEVLMSKLDLDLVQRTRIGRGWWRDRRPDLYSKYLNE